MNFHLIHYKHIVIWRLNILAHNTVKCTVLSFFLLSLTRHTFKLHKTWFIFSSNFFFFTLAKPVLFWILHPQATPIFVLVPWICERHYMPLTVPTVKKKNWIKVYCYSIDRNPVSLPVTINHATLKVTEITFPPPHADVWCER